MQGLMRNMRPRVLLRPYSYVPIAHGSRGLASGAGIAGKFASKIASRSALGVGAGVGALSWAEYKVDEFKQGTVSTLRSVRDALGDAYDGTSSVFRSWADAFASGDGNGDGGSDDGGNGDGGNRNGKGAGGGGHDGGGHNGGNGRSVATAAAAGAAVADADSPASDEMQRPSDDLMQLTRRLIEIRSTLLSIGENDALTLPSIVVIGSQSSGKSSVLEAIVGSEFLPKGKNMVTRRPIELTLVHTAATVDEPYPRSYAQFPDMGGPEGYKTHDFEQVQKNLLDLNMAIPASDCVSDSPIHLKIFSPNVPDLSLVDLPGYVQVSSMDQPPELKRRISELCERYIKAPNIILAVCAADVDLANSPALRASRRVDPLGKRTIGVVTKMDLVDPDTGAGILANEKYPLKLGYVGVVCKVPEGAVERATSSSIFRLGAGRSAADANAIAHAVRQQESAYFSKHADVFREKFDNLFLGSDVLRERLVRILESSMAASLSGIAHSVAQELEETRYQFKVQYNDRAISPESYVAETMDVLKARLGDIAQQFDKVHLRDLVKASMDDRVLDVLAAMYWNDARIAELDRVHGEGAAPSVHVPMPWNAAGSAAATAATGPSTNSGNYDTDLVWRHKLEAATSAITKSGVGRRTTQLVVDTLRHGVESLSNDPSLAHHPDTVTRVRQAAEDILRERFALASEQVENAIKPLKFEVDIDAHQWSIARAESIALLKRENDMCAAALRRLRASAPSSRALQNAIHYIERNPAASPADTSMFSPQLLVLAREALFLRTRQDALRARILALNSRRCARGPAEQVVCPEVFLDVVAAQLTTTAVQFINIELLLEFFYQLPRDLDARFSYDQQKDMILAMARENPDVARHLDMQERRDKLAQVSAKLDSLKALQSLHKERSGVLGIFGR